MVLNPIIYNLSTQRKCHLTDSFSFAHKEMVSHSFMLRVDPQENGTHSFSVTQKKMVFNPFIPRVV